MFSKTKIYGCIVACIISAGVLIQGCSDETDVLGDSLHKITLSRSDYETILKKEVNALFYQEGELKESFLMTHGLPIWEEIKWVNINSKDMLIVPLLCGGDNQKCIIGVVKNGSIVPVITELSTIDTSKKRIFSLDNKLLYKNNELILWTPILKQGGENNSSTSQRVTEDLLKDGGTAEDLYKAANENSSTYNANSKAGTLSIRSSSTGASSSLNTSGHSWVEYTDNYGNTTTFGTWGNQNDGQYLINREKKLQHFRSFVL